MICVPQVYYVGSALEGVCVFLKPGSSTKGLGVWGVCTVSSMFPGLQCSAEKLPGICWGQSFGLGVSIFLCSSFLMLLSFGISTYHSSPLYVLMIWVLLWVLPSVHHPLSVFSCLSKSWNASSRGAIYLMYSWMFRVSSWIVALTLIHTRHPAFHCS